MTALSVTTTPRTLSEKQAVGPERVTRTFPGRSFGWTLNRFRSHSPVAGRERETPSPPRGLALTESTKVWGRLSETAKGGVPTRRIGGKAKKSATLTATGVQR